jgi:adenylosuccinate lyase
LLAYGACLRGLSKLEADPARMAQDLETNWEVLAEPVQQVMRKHGVPDAYEKLKALTRGKRLDRLQLAAFIRSLPLPADAKKRLLGLTPASYIGLAPALAKRS